MSKAARSLLVFGIYLIGIGLGFLVMPNVALRIFGFPETSEPWIRVMAMLLLILAYYYIQAARNELTTFFPFTVHARASVILFGAVDLMAAIWTWVSLRSPRTSPSM